MTETPIEVLIGGTISEEIDALRQRQIENDDKAFDLQARYDKAAAKADRTGKPEDTAAADAIHSQLMGYINAGTSISEKIETLRHPSELERRVSERLANTQRINALHSRRNTMADGTKKPTAKDQGFPQVYLGENGNFRTGMDARAKSDLVLSALGEITKTEPGASLHVFTEKEAVKLLEARGWTGFLERKREILTQKAAQAERRAQERKEAQEAKAKEKADAAAAKQAEKDAAKTTPADGENEVKADPKPTSTRGRGRSTAGKK